MEMKTSGKYVERIDLFRNLSMVVLMKKDTNMSTG